MCYVVLNSYTFKRETYVCIGTFICKQLARNMAAFPIRTRQCSLEENTSNRNIVQASMSALTESLLTES